GPNTAIFSVMNTLVLRSLPVPEPDRLVYLRTSRQPDGTGNTGNYGSSFPYDVYAQLRARHEVFSDLMAFVPLALNKAAVRYGSTPEEASASMVSGNFFTGLGVRTACGRLLGMEDETQHAPVVVLSHAYWSRRFGEDCGVVGQTLHVKGVPFTIAGVAANAHLGQPKRGEKTPVLSFATTRGIAGLRDAYDQPLQLLQSIVAIVLVIACGNVALLLIARNAARQREFGVRLALGGGRIRLLQQLLAESAVLVGAGACLGWLFALAATDALSAWSGLSINSRTTDTRGAAKSAEFSFL
ncbi:MAG: ABC transporter permease, partial [Bryobacteraceae bacterium]